MTVQIINKQIRKVLKTFTENLSLYISFEIIFKLLTSILLVPFIAIVLDAYFRMFGLRYISNIRYFHFDKSIRGLVTVIVMGILMFFIVSIEKGVLIHLASDVHFKRIPSLRRSSNCIIKKIPEILIVGSVQIISFSIIILITALLGIKFQIFTNFDTHAFIPDSIFKNVNGLLVFVFFLSILFCFNIYWSFAMPCIIFGQTGVYKILSQNIELIKESIFSSIRLILYKLVAYISYLIFIPGITLIVFRLDLYFAGNKIMFPSYAFFIIIGSLVFMFFGIFNTPLGSILITDLYWERNERKDLSKVIYCESQIVELTKTGNSFIPKKRKNLIVIGFLTISVVTITLASIMLNTHITEKRVKISAHRGESSKAPENTVSSLLYAVAAEADYSELDVQQTKDGIVVLLHDQSLGRTTRLNKNIWDATFAEVEKLDAGKWFSSKFKGEKIPTLEEIIKAASGRVKLNIEIKINGNENDIGLTEKVVKMIGENEFQDKCVVTSTDYDTLLKVKEMDDSIKTGIIIYKPLSDIYALNVDFYSVKYSLITKDMIFNIHKRNKKIFAWTVNNSEDMIDMINMGVDNIITDNTEKLKDVLKEINKETNPLVFFKFF